METEATGRRGEPGLVKRGSTDCRGLGAGQSPCRLALQALKLRPPWIRRAVGTTEQCEGGRILGEPGQGVGREWDAAVDSFSG